MSVSPLNQSTLDQITEMVHNGATPKDVEIFCGKTNVEFHPLACDIAFGKPCNHLTATEDKLARDQFANTTSTLQSEQGELLSEPLPVLTSADAEAVDDGMPMPVAGTVTEPVTETANPTPTSKKKSSNK